MGGYGGRLPRPKYLTTDALIEILLSPYLELVLYLADEWILPYCQSTIISVGRRIESLLRIPHAIRLFHPPPIEPGMSESDLRHLIDNVGRALICFWAGMVARVVIYFFDEEGEGWWYKNTPVLLICTFGFTGFMLWVIWIGEVIRARRRRRVWRGLEEGVVVGEGRGGEEKGVDHEEDEYVVVEKDEGDLITF